MKNPCIFSISSKGNGKDLCDELEENVNKLAKAKTSTVTGWSINVESGQWKYGSGNCFRTNFAQIFFFVKLT